MEKEPEIRINPEETDLLVKLLKLRMKGYNDYKIGKKLSMASISVTRRLDRIERDYTRIAKFMKAIGKVRYFQKKHLEDLSLPGGQRRRDSTIIQLLSQGVPLAVGNACGPTPLAYKHVENRVKLNGAEKISLAKEMFNVYYNGGNLAQFCRNHDLGYPTNARRMMCNPLYIGIIRYMGNEYFFPELAIIDKEVWKACQPYEKPVPYKICMSKFAFIRKAGRYYKDPEKTSITNQVVDLRLLECSINEIADITGLKRWTVWAILTDPLYAGKVLVNGEYVDAGIEVIVPFKKWLKAHNILKGQKATLVARKKKRQGARDRQKELFNRIKRHQGIHFSEIIKKFHYNETTLQVYLKILKLQDRIEKRDGGWYVKSEGNTK